MRILVIGGGGREHAIIHKLKENTSIDEILCAPGNGGISSEATLVDIKATDVDGIVNFVKDNPVDFCVVTPDDPLALGMVDALEEIGVACFGPRKNAAVIEASKAFAKDLMHKYNIPTASYATFDSAKEALAYIKEKNTFPIVVKADGLALGKGVIIAGSYAEANTAITNIMIDMVFGNAGKQLVIEEFMEGPEVSVLCFTDGKTIKPMVSSMDHKRAYDNDEGLNTGGMGTIAPSPLYTEEVAKICMETIFQPTIEAMNKEGRPFKGCLYFGLMLTKDGPKVVEYNCRFGDPETQVVIPLLKTDLFEIFKAVQEERLDEISIEWRDEACACVIEASGGYPEKYEKGYPIEGLDENGQHDGVIVYHAGTKKEGNTFYTSGGRVLGITATGKTLGEALDKAYQGVEEITFKDMHYRHDIGKRWRK